MHDAGRKHAARGVEQAAGRDERTKMNPDPSLEPTTVSDFQLAMLAATIHPEACRTGDSRDALLGAMALLKESETFCTEFGAMNRTELAANR